MKESLESKIKSSQDWPRMGSQIGLQMGYLGPYLGPILSPF